MTRTKLPAKLPAPKKQPQPHGGALLVGGIPGHVGTGGRPRSDLRDRLRGTFAERVPIIEQIADGSPVKRIHVPLGAVLAHATCPKCGDKLQAAANLDAADLALIEIEARESASPSDRLKALDLAGKYGLGTQDTLTIVSPDIQARLGQQVAVIHRILPRELANQLLDALTHEVWTT